MQLEPGTSLNEGGATQPSSGSTSSPAAQALELVFVAAWQQPSSSFSAKPSIQPSAEDGSPLAGTHTPRPGSRNVPTGQAASTSPTSQIPLGHSAGGPSASTCTQNSPFASACMPNGQ